jgi:hypothetical protein
VRVVEIFAPPEDAGPLAERIAAGRRSLLFSHHADYAAITTASRPADPVADFKRAPHYLLDTRLMIAWARAFAAAGDDERARHIAARLREFRNPASNAFFAPCVEGTQPPPFQCKPPAGTLDWRDFK